MTTQKAKTRPQKAWGGARAGAGRKKTSPFVAHSSRPEIVRRQCPVEIEMKLRPGLTRLKGEGMRKVFMRASLRARRFGLRVVHFQLHSRQFRMICEFKNRKQLEHSFKSLNTTLAIAVKRRFEKQYKKEHRGRVFLDRYNLRLLDSPLSLKLALQSVLLRERPLDRGGRLYFPASPEHSSSLHFQQWAKLLGPDIKLFRQRKARRLLRAPVDWARKILASPQFSLTKHWWFAWPQSNGS